MTLRKYAKKMQMKMKKKSNKVVDEITSNERGMTPRCGDPGVLRPCIVNDFPQLRKDECFENFCFSVDLPGLSVSKNCGVISFENLK